ncbi:MAG: PEBP family protein, partial [Pseudomonadota bacterium]
VTDEGWRCVVIHTAPLDKSCENERNPIPGEGPCGFEATEEPAGWDAVDFDASGWPPASVFSEAQVRPKDGYDEVAWDDDAELIWGPDLEQSNTVLCRLRID